MCCVHLFIYLLCLESALDAGNAFKVVEQCKTAGGGGWGGYNFVSLISGFSKN